MSLRSKIILVIVAVVTIYVGVDNVVQRMMVSQSFEDLERDEAVTDFNRAAEAFQLETLRLSMLGRFIATWIETDSEVPGFGFSPEVLRQAGLHLLFICAAEGEATGEVRWGRIEDSETREPITLRDFPREALSSFHPLLAPQDPSDEVSGFLVTEDHGPMLVSSHRIEAAQGSPAYRIILGRFVNDELTHQLGESALVEFDVWPLEGELPLGVRGMLDRITPAVDPVIEFDPADESTLHVYATLKDVRDLPAILLRANVKREITGRGYETVKYSLLSALATALLILLLLLFLLQKIVIRPLSLLTDHAVTIGRNDDTGAKLDMRGNDEIGRLSREFDRMMEKLAFSRGEIIKTARLAGMSDIASGVLHNVGNVLNSVGVSSSMVTRTLERISVNDLQMMVEVLKENEGNLAEFITNDSRGKHLLFYFSTLTETLTNQRNSAMEEMQSLTKGIDHIKELVHSQQKVTGQVGLRERVALQAIFEEALGMCQQAFGQKEEIQIVREYQEVPEVSIDKHKLMEIVINLIQNARQAMQSNGSRPRVLTLRLRRLDPEWASMEVEDSGMGISQENLARVFNLGFTTKKEGHGFGLHLSANSATEMHAYLSVQSDGVNRGATFKLTVPLKAVSNKLSDSQIDYGAPQRTSGTA